MAQPPTVSSGHVASVQLWVAQGFGAGRLPAPGTWGSAIGLIWCVLLVLPGRWWVYVTGLVISALLGVYLCGRAEKMLGTKDHQSIVLDEIVAVPVCFLGSFSVLPLGPSAIETVGSFFTLRNFVFALLLFVAFRFFDIVKPWPVKQSQQLPGGWGVVADDLIAAGYVNLVWLITHALLTNA